MKASELFRKYPKTPVFDHSNYRLFERIPAVPGTSNNRGLTVLLQIGFLYCKLRNKLFDWIIEKHLTLCLLAMTADYLQTI